MDEHDDVGEATAAFSPVVLPSLPHERWIEHNGLYLLLVGAVVVVLLQIAERKPGNLRLLTVKGCLSYQLESWRFERLLDAAACGNQRALRQVTSRPYLSVATFAADHPDLVRPEARISELDRREGDLLPLPPRAVQP